LAPVVAGLAAPFLGWDAVRQRNAGKEYEDELDRIFSLDS
jgi:hypothetical protein